MSKVDSFDKLDVHTYGLSQEIIKLIKNKLAHKTPNISIYDLLVSLSGGNSFNPSDIKYMKNILVKEYVHWITTESKEDVIRLLRRFLERFPFNGEGNDVVSNIQKALDQVKTRSILDCWRVEYLIEGKKD